MEPVTILHVIPSGCVGGGSNHLLSLVTNLDRKKYNLVVACPDDGPLADNLRMSGIDVKIFQLSKFHFGTILNIYRIICESRPDILYLHGTRSAFYGGMAVSISGIHHKIIYENLDVSFYEYRSSFARIFFKIIEKINSKIANVVIIGSEIERNKFIENNIITSDRIKVIYYGIDLKRFDGEITKANSNLKKQELGLPISATIIGMVAVLKPKKGPQYFVEAAAKVLKEFSDVIFLLVGDGPLSDELHTLVKKLGIDEKFFFTGTRTDIIDIYNIIDISVLSSLWEGLPLFVLESMAARKPIVTTNVGGIAEAIKDGKNGILVPPADSQALATAILILLRNMEFGKLMGNRARKTIEEKFSLETMIRNNDKLYDALIHGYCYE